jgi:hypothetical protein
VNANPADRPRALEADVRPGLAAVGCFVDPVALNDVAAQFDFACRRTRRQGSTRIPRWLRRTRSPGNDPRRRAMSHRHQRSSRSLRPWRRSSTRAAVHCSPRRRSNARRAPGRSTATAIRRRAPDRPSLRSQESSVWLRRDRHQRLRARGEQPTRHRQIEKEGKDASRLLYTLRGRMRD